MRWNNAWYHLSNKATSGMVAASSPATMASLCCRTDPLTALPALRKVGSYTLTPQLANGGLNPSICIAAAIRA